MCVDHAGAWIIAGLRTSRGRRARQANASGSAREIGEAARVLFVCVSSAGTSNALGLASCSCSLLKCGVCVKMIFRNSLSRATQLRDTSHTHIFRAGPPSEAWPAAHITPPPGLLPTPHTALDIKKEGSPSYPYPFNRPDPRAFPTIMANLQSFKARRSA